MCKKIKSLCGVFISLFLMSTSVWAYSYDDIENWVGNGENEIGFIMDFNDGSAVESHAWGYRYNGSIPEGLFPGTGFPLRDTFMTMGMTQDIIAADEKLTGISWPANGLLLWMQFNYDGQEQSGFSGTWFPLMTDSEILDGQEIWQYTADQDAVIENDEIKWYAWGWKAGTSDIDHLVSAPASAPVPEPATFTLLGIGLLCTAALGRKRR